MTTLEKLEELVYVGFKETDQKWQETDRKWQETDRKWQETDRKLRESDARFRAWMRELSQETDRKIGDLGNKWGAFVENLVAPAAIRLFAERGIRVTRIAQNVRQQDGDGGIEIDILASNGEYVILIEVKSTLTVQDVTDHLKRLKKFPRLFPEYRQHHIVGAVAGIEIVEEADRFAYRQGLFVIAQNGDSVTILNDAKFLPKYWEMA